MGCCSSKPKHESADADNNDNHNAANNHRGDIGGSSPNGDHEPHLNHSDSSERVSSAPVPEAPLQPPDGLLLPSCVQSDDELGQSDADSPASKSPLPSATDIAAAEAAANAARLARFLQASPVPNATTVYATSDVGITPLPGHETCPVDGFESASAAGAARRAHTAGSASSRAASADPSSMSPAAKAAPRAPSPGAIAVAPPPDSDAFGDADRNHEARVLAGIRALCPPLVTVAFDRHERRKIGALDAPGVDSAAGGGGDDDGSGAAEGGDATARSVAGSTITTRTAVTSHIDGLYARSGLAAVAESLQHRYTVCRVCNEVMLKGKRLGDDFDEDGKAASLVDQLRLRSARRKAILGVDDPDDVIVHFDDAHAVCRRRQTGAAEGAAARLRTTAHHDAVAFCRRVVGVVGLLTLERRSLRGALVDEDSINDPHEESVDDDNDGELVIVPNPAAAALFAAIKAAAAQDGSDVAYVCLDPLLLATDSVASGALEAAFAGAVATDEYVNAFGYSPLSPIAAVPQEGLTAWDLCAVAHAVASVPAAVPVSALGGLLPQSVLILDDSCFASDAAAAATAREMARAACGGGSGRRDHAVGDTADVPGATPAGRTTAGDVASATISDAAGTHYATVPSASGPSDPRGVGVGRGSGGGGGVRADVRGAAVRAVERAAAAVAAGAAGGADYTPFLPNDGWAHRDDASISTIFQRAIHGLLPEGSSVVVVRGVSAATADAAAVAATGGAGIGPASGGTISGPTGALTKALTRLAPSRGVFPPAPTSDGRVAPRHDGDAPAIGITATVGMGAGDFAPAGSARDAKTAARAVAAAAAAAARAVAELRGAAAVIAGDIVAPAAEPRADAGASATAGPYAAVAAAYSPPSAAGGAGRMDPAAATTAFGGVDARTLGDLTATVIDEAISASPDVAAARLRNARRVAAAAAAAGGGAPPPPLAAVLDDNDYVPRGHDVAALLAPLAPLAASRPVAPPTLVAPPAPDAMVAVPSAHRGSTSPPHGGPAAAPRWPPPVLAEDDVHVVAATVAAMGLWCASLARPLRLPAAPMRLIADPARAVGASAAGGAYAPRPRRAAPPPPREATDAVYRAAYFAEQQRLLLGAVASDVADAQGSRLLGGAAAVGRTTAAAPPPTLSGGTYHPTAGIPAAHAAIHAAAAALLPAPVVRAAWRAVRIREIAVGDIVTLTPQWAAVLRAAAAAPAVQASYQRDMSFAGSTASPMSAHSQRGGLSPLGSAGSATLSHHATVVVPASSVAVATVDHVAAVVAASLLHPLPSVGMASSVVPSLLVHSVRTPPLPPPLYQDVVVVSGVVSLAAMLDCVVARGGVSTVTFVDDPCPVPLALDAVGASIFEAVGWAPSAVARLPPGARVASAAGAVGGTVCAVDAVLRDVSDPSRDAAVLGSVGGWVDQLEWELA